MIMKNGKRVVEVFKGNVEIGTIKHGTDTVFNNTSEYVGTLPVTINSVRAENLKSYKFSGNTVQNGTPTPNAPIDVNGVGDLVESGEHAGQYDIPITSANTTTNIYLGEVPTTRKIKKLVFDGTEEGWEKSATRAGCFALRGVGAGVTEKTMYCTHATYVSTASQLTSNNTCYMGNDLNIWLDLFNAQTTNDQFKNYLAQQYAAGTPVCVWYVLANEETGIVNEPLMKIGTYVDTVSKEQTGIQIPTNNGTTVIDVDTTVSPSSAYLKWKGYK